MNKKVHEISADLLYNLDPPMEIPLRLWPNILCLFCLTTVRCANLFIEEKITYVRQTTCKSTKWVVYVRYPRKPFWWNQAKEAYKSNGIMAFADAIRPRWLNQNQNQNQRFRGKSKYNNQ